MKTFKVTCIGTGALLVSNPQTSNPLNPLTQEIKELTSKRQRTDADELEIQRLKWRAAMYFNEKQGPVLPSTQVWKSIHNAAKITRQGKDIERGLVIHEPWLPIEYEGPRTLDAMWAQRGKFVDVRDAVAAGRRITAVRPQFLDWRVGCTASIEEEILNPRDFVTFCEKAGRFMGLGTYRLLFGRYEPEVLEI